jgi:hypothetical protein
MEDYKFKKSYFDSLQDYIQSGSKENLTPEEEKYLEVLYLVNSMRRKYGKENAISFIQRPPFNIPYRKSRELYDESINLFYGDDNVEKQAHRNALFEELMAAARLAMATAKNSRDLEVYADIVSRAYKIKGLDIPEPPKIPEDLYKKPIKVYSLNPAAISLQLESRHEIAAMIDKLDIEEREKMRLKQESQVTDINFLELYDEQESKIESQS